MAAVNFGRPEKRGETTDGRDVRFPVPLTRKRSFRSRPPPDTCFDPAQGPGWVNSRPSLPRAERLLANGKRTSDVDQCSNVVWTRTPERTWDPRR